MRALFTTPTLAELAASFETCAGIRDSRQPHSIPSRNNFFFGIVELSI